MSVLDINTRLKSLSEANRGVSQLISRLSKLSSSSDPQADEEQVRVELSAEIHQSFKELEEDFELVKQEAEDVISTGKRRVNTERETEKVAIATQVERLGEDLKLARAQFRKAQLQAKRNAETAKRKEREQLFAGVQEGIESGRTGRRRGQEKLSQDELLLNASNDVTAALRRTHQLMQTELQRSQFAHETLQQSTAALSSLNESYSTLDTLLSSSKSLVSTLLSSQKSDTWYLETAFWILVYTISWLVFRRIFYGPIRYLLYIPTRWMLNIFLSFVNLLFGLAASSADSAGSVQSERSSLVIKPSASGRGTHRFNPNMPKPSVPSGAGGQGAKEGKEGEGITDRVGKMAEETREQEEQQQSGGGESEDAEGHEAEEEEQEEQWTHEGEDDEGHGGTVLREPTEEETPNPKKRMWEEPQEAEGHDEL